MNPSAQNQPPIGYNLPPGGVSGHGVRMMPSPGPKFYSSPASVPGSMNHIQPMANAPASAPVVRPIHQTGVSNMVVNPMQPAPSVGGMMPIKRPGQGNVPIGPASGRSQPLKKKRKIGDKVIPAQVCELVPESQAYMDLLAFERKLDATITRKRLEIQEALKRPMKIRRKLRIYVSHTFYPGKEPENENEEGQIAQWELRVEGRLMDETGACPPTNQSSPAAQQKGESKTAKRKFSSFFKSLVIELDKDIYGPDNHLVEWHRTPSTNETDGFQVKRPGDRSVKCTILLLLDYQPMKFKLDPRLARILGTHTETRPKIIEALWQYVKTHKLQDANERDHINCDKYLEQIFQCQRMRFMEVPQRLNALLHPPDPIVINHIITCNVEGSEPKKTACYDIDVEIDDPIKMQMSQFLSVQQNQNEIGLNNAKVLDAKIFETVEQIQQFKTQREFFLGFSQNPQEFIQKWLISQCRDLKLMTDVNGQPETERQADYFTQPWMHEAVGRYFYSKVQQKRAELEQALGIRNM